MAPNVEVFQRTAYDTMIETFLTAESDMLLLCTPDIDSAAYRKTIDFDGAAKFNTQTTASAATARDVRGFASTSAPAVKEARVPLTDKQYRDVLDGGGLDIAVEVGGMLANNALGEIVDDYFTLLASGRTTAHPENGVSGSPYAANGGGTVYYVDNFDMTGINGDLYTQTNDHSLALSAGNLDTVLQKRRTYKNRDGKARAAVVPPWLVVGAGASLESLGMALAAQAGRVYDGSGLQFGFAGRLQGVIVAPSGTFSGDQWALVYVTPKRGAGGRIKRAGPVQCHLRLSPEVRVAQAVDGNYFNVIVQFEFDNYFKTWEGDLLHSKP